MFDGKAFWLIGSFIMFGCSLTPAGLQVGKAALEEGVSVTEAIQDTDGDGVIGWREMAEGIVGGGFLLNWLRNRKYTQVRKPAGENTA